MKKIISSQFLVVAIAVTALAAGFFALQWTPLSRSFVNVGNIGNISASGPLQKITTPIGQYSDLGYEVVMQADGKFIVSGSSQQVTTGINAALVRYNADGTLDTSFSGDGIVTTPISTKPQSRDQGGQVAVQEDGKIVQAVAVNNGFANNGMIGLVRYTPAGILDTSFDGDGIATTSFNRAYVTTGGNGSFPGLGIQSDGNIVAAVGIRGKKDTIGVVRYRSNGSLDTSFGRGGTTIIPVAQYGDMVLTEDNKILVAGFGVISNQMKCVLTRLTSTGVIDKTFGTRGQVIVSYGSQHTQCLAMALQKDGKIVFGGTTGVIGSATGFIARLNANGTSDTTFGIGGKKVVNDVERIVGLIVGSDGKIWSTNWQKILNPKVNLHPFIVSRFSANGDFDPSFGTNGTLRESFSNTEGDQANGIVLTPTGFIVVGSTFPKPPPNKPGNIAVLLSR